MYVSKHAVHNNIIWFLNKCMQSIPLVKVLGEETMESGAKRRIRSGKTSRTTGTTKCVRSLEQWKSGAEGRLSEVSKLRPFLSGYFF